MTLDFINLVYYFHNCYCQTWASHLLPGMTPPAWQSKLLYDFCETDVKTPAWVDETYENFKRYPWPVIIKIQSYLHIYFSNYLLEQAVHNLGHLLKRKIKEKLNSWTERLFNNDYMKAMIFFFSLGIPFLSVVFRSEKSQLRWAMPINFLWFFTDIFLWKCLHLKKTLHISSWETVFQWLWI